MERRIIQPGYKPVKPGHKTTEFYITIATMFFGALASGGLITPHEASQATSLVGTIAAGIAGAGYAISRGLAKK